MTWRRYIKFTVTNKFLILPINTRYSVRKVKTAKCVRHSQIHHFMLSFCYLAALELLKQVYLIILKNSTNKSVRRRHRRAETLTASLLPVIINNFFAFSQSTCIHTQPALYGITKDHFDILHMVKFRLEYANFC
jgi:hypothetical protein